MALRTDNSINTKSKNESKMQIGNINQKQARENEAQKAIRNKLTGG